MTEDTSLSYDAATDEWSGGECGAGNGSWWWGCNVCWCGGSGGGAGGGGGAQCTRLWCGLADCLRAGAACRADEVCVPAAPALCLRAPCAAPGECRRVVARAVAAPALPAPPACWPGAPAPPPPGCARVLLELARERLARGAHVERACWWLRRALAAALAPRLTPLALLCDLAPDDDDALDLALWVGEEEGPAGAATLDAALRALDELLARRRLAPHALLGAALRLRTAPAPPAPPPAGAAPALAAALAAAAALLLAGLALLLLQRRRAAAERARRCDEEKSNNLQNEENLRRYANPLHAPAPAPPAAAPHPRALALYKAHNADARNNTPPRAPDKDFAKRALPPPDAPAPAAPAPAPAPAPRPPLQPPERLTVLV
ncbi:unnamed protein product [Plutella xylostella]|uniref:(diamondback moth) hypothetical protein n=1 Tax=Plutella xylostella TaxID=51655 RepID=A0A8S4FL09_PLUXY|nr:unnamed protein product [Plutella xylostella]